MYIENYLIGDHAYDQMADRKISKYEVDYVLRNGEVIEAHPFNNPPKELFLAFLMCVHYM